MYCTINVSFQCKGDAEEALPKLQAMLNDVEDLLSAKHAAIESPQFDDRLTRDDIVENPSTERDLEG